MSFDLSPRVFAYYDVQASEYRVEDGEYQILIGASSEDIRLAGSVLIRGSASKTLNERSFQDPITILDLEPDQARERFEGLLGRELPVNLPARKGAFGYSTPIGDLETSFLGKLLVRYLRSQIGSVMEVEENTPTALFIEVMVRELPLRGLLYYGGGLVTREILEALLLALNGRLLRFGHQGDP
jgi:beta-glucosidase